MSPRLTGFPAIFLLVLCQTIAIAAPPEIEPAVRRDRYGDPLPPGAIARLGTTRFRSAGMQTDIALSPDGKILALGGVRSLRLVNSTTGAEVRTIELAMGLVESVRFSADGKRFAAIRGDAPDLHPVPIKDRPGDKTPIVGEVASGKLLLQADSNSVCSQADFSPDGRWLFALHRSADKQDQGAVICWDVDRRKELWRTSTVCCFACSPDGKILAGGEKNGSVCLWDAASGRERGRLAGHRNAIQALAFSPDSRTLVSTSGDPEFQGGENPPERSMRMWDVAAGKQRFRSKVHLGDETVVRFAPDGRTLVTMERERRNFHLWDTASGELRQYFPGEGEPDEKSYLFAFAFSPDGKMLFYQCQEDGIRTIYQWDIFAGKEVRHWETEASPFSALAVSPDAKRLFGQGNGLHIWNLDSGAEWHDVPAHRSGILSLRFSPDGRRLASQDDRLECRLWDPLTGAPLACAPPTPGQRVYLHDFSGDGKSFILLHQDASVQVWDSASGKEVRRFRVGRERDLRMWQRFHDIAFYGESMAPILFRDTSASFHAGKNLLAVSQADQHIHLWDATRGKELRVIQGHRGGLFSLAFSSQGNFLLSHGEDETFRLWDVANGSEVRRLVGERGVSRSQIALSLDERQLAWAAGDREAIHLWDTVERKEVVRLRSQRGEVERLLFHRDGTLLASYHKDRRVRLWDAKTGDELDSFLLQGEEPNFSLEHSPDGHVLAIGSLTKDQPSLRDLSTGQNICELGAWPPPGVIGSARIADAFSPDGRTLAVYGDRLILRERASGGIVAEMPSPHQGGPFCLAFSPDGRCLATGGQNSTILIWDWQRLAGLRRAAGERIGEDELQAAWIDLASADARKGYRAIGALIASADKAVSLLRSHLRPASVEEWQEVQVRRLIEKLKDSDFAVREKASQELLRLGVEVRIFLCRVSKEKVALETRRRLEHILENAAMRQANTESVRKIRAVQVLEGIASPAARELLAAWSRGNANSWLTRESEQALRRLHP